MNRKSGCKDTDRCTPEGSGTGESMQERVFDRWLDRQLHRLFDPVLSEEVPDDIMRLLDKFEKGPDDPSEGGAEG